jgi:16S rRNA (uracil1498-N3)-methyltransferase
VIPRSYAPDAERVGTSVKLSREESAHLRQVLRVRDGAEVRIFDGQGREFDGHVELVGRTGARASLDAERSAAPEPRVSVTLAVAVLKGEAMDAVVRDAVMLGVASLQPIVTARSQTGKAAVAEGRRPDRWRRVAVASAKQCGRATVPDIRAVLDSSGVAEALGAGTLAAPAFLLVEPSAGTGTGSGSISEVPATAPAAATVVIGAEGGWTLDELRTLWPVTQPITLGGLVLRAEAAPLVALSALFARWGAFDRGQTP